MAGRKPIYKTDDEKRIAQNKRSKKWRDNNKSQFKQINKNQKLKMDFGITLDDYNIMLFEQDGCCAICNAHHTKFNRALSVDHCHTTGKIRGLLCNNCNTAIGKLKEDPKLFQSALKYLKNG